MARQRVVTLVALLAGSALACSGSIGDGSGESSGGGPSMPAGGTGSGPPGGTGAPGGGGVAPGGGGVSPGGGGVAPGGGGVSPGGGAGDPNAAGPMPLRRLTRREYNNTVRDLLGETTNPADAFPVDRESEFLFRRAGLVALQDLETMKDAAQALGASAVNKATTLAPCTGDESACARKFVTTFGQRAFRRPVTTEETDRLMALYQTGRTTLMLNYASAIGLLVEGMLQSPAFLYHWELGYDAPKIEGSLVRLNGYETASRLSYFLWGSMPDANLFEAAAANKLGTQAEIEAQARRMLGDAKARDTVPAFIDELLNLDQIAERPKDPLVYPEYKDDLKAAMATEIRTFINSVVDGDGKFSTLLTSTAASINQPLATLYGVSGVSGAGVKAATLDTKQRAGLLTRAGFLTVTGATDGSHPVKRGRRIYERMLCGALPSPPADVPPAATPASGGTTRQRFDVHANNPCTGGCHSVMDKLGFAFEHYDGIGKFRTMDNGGVVDSSGTVEIDGVMKPFADAIDISKHLAESPGATRCFTTQWMRFGFQRLDTADDRASIDAAVANFGKTNNIKDLLVGIAGSRSFRYRTPAMGEKLQ
jgi:hypothetical protein